MHTSLLKPDSAPDKSGLLVPESEHGLLPGAHATVTVPIQSPKLDGSQKPYVGGNAFLGVPLSAPIRPLSPDTLSNFSIDEYDQLGFGRRTSEAQLVPLRGWRGRLQAFWIHNKGLLYMLLAQVFGTLMNVTTRLLEIEGNNGKGLHPFQILFVRMGITVVLASAYMWYRRIPHFPLGMPEVRWLLAARGFGGFFGVFGMYYSLLYLPLADATVITFLAPGLTCWACSILINEPFTRVEQIGTMISFLGVVFIARPSTLFHAFGGNGAAPVAGSTGDMALVANSTAPPIQPDATNYDNVTPAQRLGAVGISMLGVAGATIAYTTIRWIGKRAHPLISVNYFATWCTIVSLVMQLILPGVGFLLPADRKEWGYLIFLGTCGFIMQFLMSASLSYEKSSRATNMTYTQMLFALGADKLIFGHSPTILSIIGSSLILGSAIVVALQKGVGVSPQVRESTLTTNDESQRGLLRDAENGQDHERMPVQEVQMRTLR